MKVLGIFENGSDEHGKYKELKTPLYFTDYSAELGAKRLVDKANNASIERKRRATIKESKWFKYEEKIPKNMRDSDNYWDLPYFTIEEVEII